MGAVEGEAVNMMGNGGSQQAAALARDDLWGEEEEGERLESRGDGRDDERGKPLGFLALSALG